jgi:hypothetical protein
MSVRPSGTRADQTIDSAWGREAARLLALLKHNRDGGVTVAAMREHGIGGPAQAIYTLQLAGYVIDRVPGDPTGRKAPTYRLRRGARYPKDDPSSLTAGRRG